MDCAYVSQIEREQGNVTVDLLDRLAAVLECRPSEFLDEPVDGAAPQKLRSGRKLVQASRAANSRRLA